MKKIIIILVIISFTILYLRYFKTNTKEVVKKSEEGVIYLSFDDGPSPQYTHLILDILKKYDIKATFFIVPKGNIVDDIIKREDVEGHSIGIHSFSHIYSQIYSSEDALYEDISKVNEKIKKITDKYSYLYRYPGGSSNTIYKHYNKNLIKNSTSLLHKMGFHYFDWNISSGDALGSRTSKTRIYNNVIKHLKKNRDNIILMHDTKRNTYLALEDIIKYGLENGYKFEKITMNTKEMHH